MKPGVTIATPNWNHELVLPRSIKSALYSLRVLREAGIDGEVLVVDDASRDGSLTLLRQLEALYFDNGLRVIALEENLGTAAGRNVTMAAARFRHYVVLDADNQLMSDNLPIFYRAALETSACRVFGNLLYVRHGEVDRLTNATPFNRAFFEYGGPRFDDMSLLDRSRTMDNGYIRSALTQDDEQYLHSVSSGRRMVFVPMIFGYYFYLPGSVYVNEMQQRQDDPQQAHRRQRNRMFDQFGVRAHVPLKTEYLTYHSDLGYLNMDAQSNR